MSVLFYLGNLSGLIIRATIVVNNSYASTQLQEQKVNVFYEYLDIKINAEFYCNRNGHFRFSDSVHRGGNERSLQSDLLCQGRSQVLENYEQ